jgi:hypothetical protein
VSSQLPSPNSQGASATVLLAAALVMHLGLSVDVRAQGRGEQPPAGTTPRATAPFDPTGYWVAVISEDWRWRMITPAKGDFPSIPMSREGQRTADAWDPGKDSAAGEQCRAYGAPGLLLVQTRFLIKW